MTDCTVLKDARQDDHDFMLLSQKNNNSSISGAKIGTEVLEEKAKEIRIEPHCTR